MNNSFEIRCANAADHTALATIRRQAILELAVPWLSAAEAEQWADGAAADRITRAIREHHVWVAIQSVPIGWVEVDQNRIAGLYVTPRCSGKGIGSGLLRHAEAAIAHALYTVVHLEASQNSLGFYIRKGYCPNDVRRADGAWPLSRNVDPTALNQIS